MLSLLLHFNHRPYVIHLYIAQNLLTNFWFSETWKDSPDFALYLAELSASSLEKLSKSYRRHERWVYNSIYELK